MAEAGQWIYPQAVVTMLLPKMAGTGVPAVKLQHHYNGRPAMSTDSSTLTVAPPAVPAPADVIDLTDKRARRPLSICLLGYRSAPYGGGQGIYLKYLSKALVLSLIHI